MTGIKHCSMPKSDHVEKGWNDKSSIMTGRVHNLVTSNEEDLDIKNFRRPFPSFVTLISPMKMRVCEVFWRRVHVHFICFPSVETKQTSTVLCIRRRRHHGSCVLAISLDRRLHPVRLLSKQKKDSRKLRIGFEYGWHAKRLWLRAPNAAVYDQWMTVIRAAFDVTDLGCYNENLSGKWRESSSILMMETATMSEVDSMDRISLDSYVRTTSNSFQSDIPDEEWTARDDVGTHEWYELRKSQSEKSDAAVRPYKLTSRLQPIQERPCR